jgi:hypothetical protein
MVRYVVLLTLMIALVSSGSEMMDPIDEARNSRISWLVSAGKTFRVAGNKMM